MSDQELNIYIDKIYDLFDRHKSDYLDHKMISDFALLNMPLLKIAMPDTVLLKMQEFDLVIGRSIGTSQQTWELTPLGRKVLNFGSWTKYRKHVDDKELNDAKISAWLIKTKWVPHVLSGFALLIAGLSLIVSIRQCQQGQQNESTTESKTQVQHSRPTTQPTADTLKSEPIDSMDTKVKVDK